MQHQETLNHRGVMHPISNFTKHFIEYTKTHSPVIDMGCAFGNVTQAALKAGAQEVIACDMESKHLLDLQQKLTVEERQHLKTVQGLFPNDFNFLSSSIAGFYASHIFEFLTGDEVIAALRKIHQWLKSDGKLFIVCYTPYIKELDNHKTKTEYQHRKISGNPWPGFFKDYNQYADLNNDEIGWDNDSPKDLHLFDKAVLTRAVEDASFVVEYAEYQNGKADGSVPEYHWFDGRECIAIIATPKK